MSISRFRSPQARADFEAVYRTGMDALPKPVATHDLPTRFGSVRVYRFGEHDEHPMVLLPGRASTSIMWQPNLAAFAERSPTGTRSRT